MSANHDPAYPVMGVKLCMKTGDGLSKREYAAIQILSGMYAGLEKNERWPVSTGDGPWLAKLAVDQADALFDALEKS